MEKRASIPPGLPKPSPTVSYWQDPPSDIAGLRTTSKLPTSADYIIIGSGISGACIAHNLLSKKPNASVLMLEARTACSGATGRNGGHTKAASYRSFLEHERELGLEEAVKIARLEYENIIATHRLAKEYGIQCDSNPCQTVDIIHSQTQLDEGKRAIARMRQVLGEGDPAAKYEILEDAEEVESRFLTPGALGAFTYFAGSISAYAFAIGMLKVSLEQGLNLQTNTPAHSIERKGDLWEVKTSRGMVSSPNVILATNGYTAHLLKSMQGVIVPLHGQVVAQRPGSRLPNGGSLDYTYSFIYENGYEYMITRPPGSRHEGDMVIGGGLGKLPNDGESQYGNTDDTALSSTITFYLRDCTADYFGDNWGEDHPHGRVRKEWSGIMGASADGLPYVGSVPDSPGLWMSACFNGHGMVWCLKSAEALVATLVGDRAEQIVIDRWFPRSARLTKERMSRKFGGRVDLKVPGEAKFGVRSRL
ncbi:FAD dependent oxidoreductase [Polychaeton citri CBS 116435]|uniref:FAD dependent oxidoreductase n=1 Tax=Polychaeton citri CBS 116435 TaxID=1314669 RepID=A0A9P4Q451_9PEZI|nr:FAD dependent oxidoreductase [Polychaeton citri CBS 116435]